MYYVGTLEELIAVDAQMCENCGIPTKHTFNMVTPKETATSGVYAVPVVESWADFNQEQINAGIVQPTAEAVDFLEAE